jgi:autotransporter-associated beta strand protein
MLSKHASVRLEFARVLLVLTLVIGNCSLAHAATCTWQVSSGDWSTASNWGGTEPTASDDVDICNGGTATISQTGERCDHLYLGDSGTGRSGTIEMIGGDLSTASNLYVAESGIGTFTQTGGTNTVANNLELGYSSGSSGAYNLSGSGQLNALCEYVGGYEGTGAFSQTGGTNIIAKSLYIANYSTAVGDYYLSGAGQLSASDEIIGYSSGTGTLTQQGGTNSAINTQIYANGKYVLASGAFNIMGGLQNQGTWDMSNSTAVVNMSSSIVQLSGNIITTQSNATLNIDAHSLLIVPAGHTATEYFPTVNNSGIIATGLTVNIPAGYSIYGQAESALNVSVSCQGSLSATPGYYLNIRGPVTISGTGSMDLGGGDLGQGCLNMNYGTSRIDGGSLRVSRQLIHSSFTQTAGTNSSLYTLIGTAGTYALRGGTFNANGYFENQGILDLSSSTATVNLSSCIANFTRSAASFLGSGSNATLNVDAHSLAIFPSGHAPSEYFTTINNSGIIHQAGSTLTIPAGYSIYGQEATIYDHVNCLGSIVGSLVSSIDLRGGLAVSGTALVDVGNVYVNDGASGMDGGTLVESSLYIAQAGNGTFTQSGGIHTPGYQIYVGYQPGYNGTYNLSGGTITLSQSLYVGLQANADGAFSLSGSGQLSANYEYIGEYGSGAFTQTGGTHTATNLTLGHNADSSGAYDLSGTGQLSSLFEEYIGDSGTGTFTQTGGTHSVTTTVPGYLGDLYIGNKANSNGTYTQSGGINTVPRYLYLGKESGSTGSYNLSGSGQLSAKYEVIGSSGTGTFTQTGGTNSGFTINIGSKGIYILSGGEVDVGSGFGSAGTWDLTNSTAAVNLSSAILNMTGTIISTGSHATVNIDEHSLLIIPNGHAVTEYFSTVNNSGLIHQAGSTLTIPPAYTIYGGAAIDDHVICQGTLSGTSGILLKGGLNVTGAGSAIGLSELDVNDAVSGMDGGTLSIAGQLMIGKTGAGIFTQTGGTNTVSGALFVGLPNPATNSIYNLNGGTLIVGMLFKGNSTGSFNFGGGTLQPRSNLATLIPMTLTGVGGNANVDTAGYLVTLSGALSGIGGLNKLGSGTLVLGASNSFTGPVNFNGGFVQASALNRLGNGTALNFNGGGLQFAGVFDPSLRTMSFLAGGATIDTQTFNIILAYPVGNSGAGGLNKTGSGKLTLNALNTYGGNTTVKGGTLEFDGGIAAGGTSLIAIQSGTAALKTTAVNKTSLNINTAASTTFEIINGTHTVGAISGGGTTKLDAGAGLTATSISQGTITLGAGSTLTIAAIPGGPSGSAITPVPEPSASLLLLTAVLAAGLSARTRKWTGASRPVA